jgi:hypothetical protein
MLAAIIDTAGVTQAVVIENQTSAVNSYGMPPHSIWLIVAGSPTPSVLAHAIYVKRNACVDWMNGGTGGAAGTITFSGTGLNTVAVGSAGFGYDNAPTCEVTGDGAGAAVHATVSGGAITGFVVDTPGTGYTHAAITLNPNTVATAVVQADGTNFIVYYDTPTPETLWFQATLTAITGALDKTSIKNQILAQFGTGGLQAYGINQAADTASIVAFIKSIAPNASVSLEGVSTDGITFSNLVTPTDVNYQFVLTTVTIS